MMCSSADLLGKNEHRAILVEDRFDETRALRHSLRIVRLGMLSEGSSIARKDTFCRVVPVATPSPFRNSKNSKQEIK